MTITYFPLSHATGFVERATQYEPAGHNAHVMEPSLLEYVPAPQGVHAVELVDDAYPAKQIVALVVEEQL